MALRDSKGRFVKVSTTDTDLGWNRIKADFAKMGRVRPYAVGWKGTGSNGQPLAERAAFSEWGNPPRQMPRPFNRKALDDNKAKHEAIGARSVGEVIDGTRAAETVLDKLADEVLDDIRISAQTWRDPPNRPSTVKKKGRNKPLDDTGEMIAGIEKWRL